MIKSEQYYTRNGFFVDNPNIDYHFVNKYKKKAFSNNIKKLSANKFLFHEIVRKVSFKRDVERRRQEIQINFYNKDIVKIICYYIGYN